MTRTGAIVELHGVALDITERKAARDALHALATHDPLTGLANRAALLDEITRALSAGRRSGRSTAVLMMDLDRFKNVNDTLGHAAGDELLVAAAARIEEVVRGGDLVARLGGDEFVVVMRDLDDPAEAVAGGRAPGARRSAARSPSATASCSPRRASGSRVADATTQPRPATCCARPTPRCTSPRTAGRDRVSVFNEDLRAAVSTTAWRSRPTCGTRWQRGQLAVWYQPEVDLTHRGGDRGRGAAALAPPRRGGVDRGPVHRRRRGDRPDPRHRRLGAAAGLRPGRRLGGGRPDRPVTVRVNVSALQLAEAGLLRGARRRPGRQRPGPRPAVRRDHRDRAAARDRDRAATTSPASTTAASRIAIDDFGTGYASLTYLRQYPIDVIKIDRSFITDITTDEQTALVAGIIALARPWTSTVTAEGVEHPDQAAHACARWAARARRAASTPQPYPPKTSRCSSATSTPTVERPSRRTNGTQLRWDDRRRRSREVRAG